jgi:DNA-binding CsgD family transcriptional regulator
MTDSRRQNTKDRQERIKLLSARNLSVPEIAEALGVSERTVMYDKKRIRQEMADTLSRSSSRDHAAKMLNRSNARHRQLWSLYAAATEHSKLLPAASIKRRLKILGSLMSESWKEVELQLKLGIVEPAEPPPEPQ